MKNSILIANPTYDAAFKYLMTQSEPACIVLSAILGRKVKSAVPMRNEIIKPTSKTDDTALPSVDEANRHLGFLRIDYAAKVVMQNAETGEERTVDVCIELQRAHVKSQVERFREYLAGEYSNSTAKDENGNPLHIIAVYILGEPLQGVEAPLVRSSIKFEDQDHKKIKFNKPVPFIEALTNDIIIIQATKIYTRKDSTLDRILNIFRITDDNRKEMQYEFDTTDYIEDHNAMNVLYCLKGALNDTSTRRILGFEQDAIETIDENTQLKASLAKERLEKEQATARANKMEQLMIETLKQSGKTDEEITQILKSMK